MATCAIGGASHCGYVPKTKLRSSANSSQKRTLILSGYGIGPELFRKCGTEMKYKRCTADPSKPKVLVKGANKSLMNQRITRQLNYFPSSAVMLDSCGYEPTFCRPAPAAKQPRFFQTSHAVVWQCVRTGERCCHRQDHTVHRPTDPRCGSTRWYPGFHARQSPVVSSGSSGAKHWLPCSRTAGPVRRHCARLPAAGSGCAGAWVPPASGSTRQLG